MRIIHTHSAPTLGFVATGKRNIKSGVEFNHLYPSASQLERTDPIIDNGNTYRTLEIMEDYARKYKADTAKITQHLLKGRNINTQRNEILKDLWNHVYNNFQYTEDQPGIEQIRRPARSWHDRQRGIDCDCMSVLFSSMLLNLGIPHAFRKAKYKGDWQHVYVVVPKTNTKSLNKRQNYYVLDAVVDSYDYEVPFSKKHDKAMEIQGLNGMPAAGYDDFNIKDNLGLDILGIKNSRAKAEYGKEFGFLNGLADVMSDQQQVDMFMAATKRHLENTYQIIKEKPQEFEGFTYNYPVQKYLLRMRYLLDNWNDEEKRYDVINELIIAENEGLDGLFSKIGDAIRNVADKVKTGVKNASDWAKRTTSRIGSNIKESSRVVFNKVGEDLKKAGQAIVKYNPVSLAARGGLLLAFKSNLFRMAGRLGYGYWSESTARSKGMDMQEYAKIKGKLERTKRIYRGLCGGNVSNGEMDNLKNAILQGWGKDNANNPGMLRGLGIIRSMTTFAPARESISTIRERTSRTSGDRTSTSPVSEPSRDTTITFTPKANPTPTPSPTKPVINIDIPKPEKPSPFPPADLGPIKTPETPLVKDATPEQLLEHVKRGGEFNYSYDPNNRRYNITHIINNKRNNKNTLQEQLERQVAHPKKSGGTLQLWNKYKPLDRGQINELNKSYAPASPVKKPIVKTGGTKTPIRMSPPKPSITRTAAPSPAPNPAPSNPAPPKKQTTAMEPMEQLQPQSTDAGGMSTTALIIGGLVIAGGITYAAINSESNNPKANKKKALNGPSSKTKTRSNKPKKKASKNIKMTL